MLAQFVRKSLDNPPSYQREDCDGADALEEKLQDDIWTFVKYGGVPRWTGAYEPQKLAAGRADISLSILDEPMVIECKREHDDSSRKALQAKYAGQGGAYSASEHPFGAVAVLNLTAPQTASPPMFYDCLWLYQQPPEDGGRTLLFVLVPGRRKTPSKL